MSDLISVRCSSFQWKVPAEYSDRLLGAKGLRIDEWLESGNARVVKHGPHRTVYQVNLPGLSFYLKHYRLADARAWLRELVRPAKAKIEFEKSVGVAARQVPTADLLGLGVSGPGPSESFLLTRTLEDVQPLNGFLENFFPSFSASRQNYIRQDLARKLGKLVAQMHEAGILHNDLHAGNLLIHLDAHDRVFLYLIDLHAVSLGGRLNWRVSRENLIMLNRWFILRASRSDRLRFWKSYSESRLAVDGSFFQGNNLSRTPAQEKMFKEPYVSSYLPFELEKGTWQSNLHFWRQRDRRCRHNNRYYQRVGSGCIRGYAVSDLDEKTRKPFLEAPDAIFERDGVKLLKNSRSSTVAECEISVNGKATPVIFKRFRVTNRSGPILNLLRKSAALRSWIYGQGLRERLLPTARPLLVLHRQKQGLPCEGYLLTEKIENAVDLHQFVDAIDSFAPEPRRILKSAVIEEVALLARELHRRHLSHRDFKATNVLVLDPGVRISAPTNGAKVWLIDLVGIRLFRNLSRARCVQNLTRLHASFHSHPAVSRTDKLRFLKVYLPWDLKGKVGWKRWWREIGEATGHKIARNSKNNRPLT